MEHYQVRTASTLLCLARETFANAARTSVRANTGHRAMSRQLRRRKTKMNWGAWTGAVMWSHVLACALLLLPVQAMAGVKEKVAALAPSGVVLAIDEKNNELVAQNADKPFVPASVTKIVTAWLAMEVLGADYRFKTHFYLDGDRVLRSEEHT